MNKMRINVKVNLAMLFFLFMGTSVFGAIYYSDPSSSSIQLNNALLSEGWSTSATGPFNVPVTINKGDHIIIQKGSTVTAVGSGLTFNNINFEGGTLVISASSINILGNISGSGVFKNDTDNSTRIKMQGNNKTINLTTTGNAGLTIVRSVSLAGNSSIGGRISIDSLGIMDLAGHNLSIDNLVMKNGALIKGNIASSLTIESVNANANTIFLDESANKLAALTINNTGGLTFKTTASIGSLNLTKGKVLLGDNNLTYSTSQGGSPDSYIITNGAGSVICNVAAGTSVLFPVGASNATKYTTFDPVMVKPAKASTFTVSVSNAFSQPLINAKKAAGRQWNISSTVVSSTELSFTPKNAMSTKSPVVGLFVNGAWLEIPATYSENSYKTTTTDFGAFGVGEKGAFLAGSN